MMKFGKMIVVTAVAAAAVCAGPVIAQDAKAVKRAIEYRQGVLRVIGWDMGPMGAMAKGKIPFDAAEFARRAERLAIMAPRALEGFPEGTASVDGTPTRADKRVAKKIIKQAKMLKKQGEILEAADLLWNHELMDEAAEVYLDAGEFVRAQWKHVVKVDGC